MLGNGPETGGNICELGVGAGNGETSTGQALIARDVMVRPN